MKKAGGMIWEGRVRDMAECNEQEAGAMSGYEKLASQICHVFIIAQKSA